VRAGGAAARWLTLAIGLGVAGSALAQNPVRFSSDITAEIGAVLPKVVTDDDVAADGGTGILGYSLPPGTLPPEADVSGYERLPGGDSLLSLDVSVPLPGLPPGTAAEPRDVVRFDPNTLLFAFELDGSAAGVPLGPRIDAVTVNGAGDVIVSFDTSVTLPGPLAVDDEDLVRFAGGVFTLFYDGSASSMPPRLDLDAAHVELGTPNLWLSFDGTAKAAGVIFRDEDVLSFDTGTGIYTMYYDGSLSDPDWAAADVVAVPEPAVVLGLLAGAGLLAVLARARRD